MNLGIGVGTAAGAVLAGPSSPTCFKLLFALQAVIVLGFAALLAGVPDVLDRRRARQGGYRRVLADRPSDVSCRWSRCYSLPDTPSTRTAFPDFATGPANSRPRPMASPLPSTPFTIVVAQLPVVRLGAGWRRSRGLAVVGCLWACGSLPYPTLSSASLSQGRCSGSARPSYHQHLARSSTISRPTPLARATTMRSHSRRPPGSRLAIAGALCRRASTMAACIQSSLGLMLSPLRAQGRRGAGLVASARGGEPSFQVERAHGGVRSHRRVR
jgi:hypothetical protein